MKHIIESIGKYGSLYKILERSFSKDQDTLIISYDPEDNLNLDIAKEYGLSELIIKRDDAQKKVFNTNNLVIELVSIQIDPEFRHQGLSKKVLDELVYWADKTNTVIVGDPDDMFKTPLDVLYKLYGKFGFERSEKYNPIPNSWGKYHKIVRFPR